MTCEQMRILASAHPFVAYAPRELRAAEDHAASCPGCLAFWDEVRTLEAQLGSLPEIVLPDPEAITDDIMARIAAGDASPVLEAEAEEAPAHGDWLPWGSAAGGLVIAGSAYASGWLEELPQVAPFGDERTHAALIGPDGAGPRRGDSVIRDDAVSGGLVGGLWWPGRGIRRNAFPRIRLQGWSRQKGGDESWEDSTRRTTSLRFPQAFRSIPSFLSSSA